MIGENAGLTAGIAGRRPIYAIGAGTVERTAIGAHRAFEQQRGDRRVETDDGRQQQDDDAMRHPTSLACF